jgi:hypothetical protein
VRELRDVVDAPPSAPAERLSILRRDGLITGTRTNGTVIHELADEDIADLPRVAQRILARRRDA